MGCRRIVFLVTVSCGLRLEGGGLRREGGGSFLGVLDTANVMHGPPTSGWRPVASALTAVLDPHGCTDAIIATGYVQPFGDDYPYYGACGQTGSEDLLCVSSHTLLTMEGDVPIFAKDVEIGESLVGQIGPEMANFEGEKVVMMLHRDTQAKLRKWVRVDIFPYTSLVISPNHFVVTRYGLKTARGLLETIDEVFFYPGRIWVNVTQVSLIEVEDEGVHAPYTLAENYIADGILVSVFSAISMTDNALWINWNTKPQSRVLKLVAIVENSGWPGYLLKNLATNLLRINARIWKKVPSGDFLDRIKPVANFNHDPIIELMRVSIDQLAWMLAKVVFSVSKF